MAFYDSITDHRLAEKTPIREKISLLLLRYVNKSQETRQAHALRNLSDAQLRDIGITREQAEAEAARLSWTPPIAMRGQ